LLAHGAMARRDSRRKEVPCPPGEPLEAMQVSLSFDRAHPQVWEFFRKAGRFVLAARQQVQKRLNELQDGRHLIVYVPESQGGSGLLGLGIVTGGVTTFEQGGYFTEDDFGNEYREHMQALYSDPNNKPAQIKPRFKHRFQMHRRRLSGQEGEPQGASGFSASPWEFGRERWASEEAWRTNRRCADAFMVHFPVRWEATVAFRNGISSFDWASLGLADVSLKFCQLSSICHRCLSTEHWGELRSGLEAAAAALPAAPASPPRPSEEAPAKAPPEQKPKPKAKSTAAKAQAVRLRQQGRRDRLKRRPSQSELAPTESEKRPVRPKKAARTNGSSPSGAAKKNSWQDLADLLDAAGLHKYLERLRAEEVDLDALKLLTDMDLAELGLPLGPRRKLQAALSGAVQ